MRICWLPQKFCCYLRTFDTIIQPSVSSALPAQNPIKKGLIILAVPRYLTLAILMTMLLGCAPDSDDIPGGGYYSSNQAARGQVKFGSACSHCHSIDEFSGPLFEQRWAEWSVYDLYTSIRQTMPEDDPGALPPQAYVDIVSYLMAANLYPAGSSELQSNDRRMREIRLEKFPQPKE